MAYNSKLADRIREYLVIYPDLQIKEEIMFGGLAFLVNGKMCVNVSGEDLMCRFNPSLQAEVAERQGYKAMIMKGKELSGYCYVDSTGFDKEFDYWLKLCLDYNDQAKPSKKKREGT